MVTLKKSTFLWKFYFSKLFLEQSALLPPQLKLFLTFCHQWIWGRNYCQNLDNAVSLPPKIAPFTPFLNTKPFFAVKMKKITIPNDLHHWKARTETIFLSLVLNCQYILIWGLEFFQRSGHHMLPISCKASYRFWKPNCFFSLFTPHRHGASKCEYSIILLLVTWLRGNLVTLPGQHLPMVSLSWVIITKKSLIVLDWVIP